MFPADIDSEAAVLLARLDAALDGLMGLELGVRTNDQVLGLWRELETRRNRFAAVDHALINEAASRRLDVEYGARTVTALARQVLRIDSRHADARVKAAAALGPRRSLTGEVLPPIYAAVAAGQARGSVNEAAARAITSMIEHLPDEVRAEKDLEVEAFLVEQAELLDTDAIRKLVTHTATVLDPDGKLTELERHAKFRDLRLKVRANGTARLEGELTPECAEHLQVMLDHLSGPRPAADGQKDPRTAGNRRHDALLDALCLLERAEQLPNTAGVSATILLMMNENSYRTGTGVATTGHGVTLPASEALRCAGGDARIIAVVKNSLGAVTHYSNLHRIFTEHARLAMTARDRGCSFPGCDVPPLWTEAHHVTNYSETGRTTIDDGTLVCGYHHREHQRMGYHSIMINHLPHWIPPRHIDPQQRPLRNHQHDVAPG